MFVFPFDLKKSLFEFTLVGMMVSDICKGGDAGGNGVVGQPRDED